MSDLQSRVFEPNPEKCCEACIFGAAEHADWCYRPGLPGNIPSDCEFCPIGECGDCEAVGMLGQRSICQKCVDRGIVSPSHRAMGIEFYIADLLRAESDRDL